MLKKLKPATSLIDNHYLLQEKWKYIEDPTYSRSINSHVCITCSKFDYSNMASFGSILYCKWHQKLICHGQHLTHSCELYQTNVKFKTNKKLNYNFLAS